jgi:hypothetical protein
MTLEERLALGQRITLLREESDAIYASVSAECRRKAREILDIIARISASSGISFVDVATAHEVMLSRYVPEAGQDDTP